MKEREGGEAFDTERTRLTETSMNEDDNNDNRLR
jgi:hypothetical protein